MDEKRRQESARQIEYLKYKSALEELYKLEEKFPPPLAAILIYDAKALETQSVLLDHAVRFEQIIVFLKEEAGPVVRWAFDVPEFTELWLDNSAGTRPFFEPRLKGFRRGERVLLMHSKNFEQLMKIAQSVQMSETERASLTLHGPRIIDLNKEEK